MKAGQRWQSPHYRRGCWVEAHHRSNGVHVKRHWRNGHNVSGHYSLIPEYDNPDHEPTERTRPRSILVDSGLNNAPLIIALENAGIGRAITRAPKTRPCAQARLLAVSWTLDCHQTRITGIPVVTGMVNLPPEVDDLTLEMLISDPEDDQGAEAMTVDAPCFANADGTITVVRGAQVDPERVNRALKATGSETSLDDRNRVRELLGHTNPELTLQQALADTFRETAFPDLPISQRVTVPMPGSGYTITVEREPQET